ncbi:MAG: flagellar hook-associated protein 3 [Planctomycetota bacterium]|nr:MAG: flagellar hook-associated protein 3 [Planctomycetota bacterium]
MSGTLSNVYNNAGFALSLHTDALARLQEQASTGSRVNRPSDDPSAAYQILGLSSQGNLLANYMDNLSQVVDTLGISSSTISNMQSSLTQVKVLLTQVASGVYDEQARERTSGQINDILEHMVLLANTEHMNEYLFGGGDSTSAPYTVERTDGKITSVNYQGNSQGRNIEVAPGVQAPAFYAGDSIFRSDGRAEPIFSGLTGAAPGTGTSNVRGDVWLTVIHDGSNYKISIDDGLTYTTVLAGGDANQAVTDSITRRILYVDTTQINSTGVELVRVPGTYDIFNTLISLRNILANERGLSDEQLNEVRGEAQVALDELQNLLVQTSVTIGAKIGFLSDLKDSLAEQSHSAEDQIARLEDADIAQIAIDLSKRELLYQMSLAAVGKIMSMSLLDFI